MHTAQCHLVNDWAAHAEAANRISANGGKSSVLEELVGKCLPLIEEARREDTELADEEAAGEAGAAAAPPAPGGGNQFSTIRAAPAPAPAPGVADVGDGLSTMRLSGTMRVGGDTGTMRRTGDGDTGTMRRAKRGGGVVAWGTIRRAPGGGGGADRVASGTMVVADEANASAPAAAPASSGDPAFMKFFRGQKENGTPAPAPAPVPAPAPAPSPPARTIYDKDAGFLGTLSLAALQVGLFSLCRVPPFIYTSS